MSLLIWSSYNIGYILWKKGIKIVKDILLEDKIIYHILQMKESLFQGCWCLTPSGSELISASLPEGVDCDPLLMPAVVAFLAAASAAWGFV